jgi:hypothetical protein
MVLSPLIPFQAMCTAPPARARAGAWEVPTPGMFRCGSQPAPRLRVQKMPWSVALFQAISRPVTGWSPPRTGSWASAGVCELPNLPTSCCGVQVRPSN